jgi:hypothetical protein
MLIRPAAPRVLSNRFAIALTALTLAALAGPALAAAAPKGDVVTFKAVQVGAPGNQPVGILPFTDAVYRSCAEAPESEKECLTVGAVKYRYGLAQLEVTVKQWVGFLNTVDPNGRNRRHLYSTTESPSAWPRFGQIGFSASARRGRHYSVASQEWIDKPYAFANFPRAARFVNSLYNGRLSSRRVSSDGPFRYVTYRVRLSKQTERGMYDLTGAKRPGVTRAHKSGFVLPSQDEWIKAAYYDPSSGGTYSYWKYPTNAGVFGDGTATAPKSTTLNPGSGEVTNASTQPLATYHASEVAAPSWCPAVQPAEACATVNPFGIPPMAYEKAFQGSVGSVGQALTTSPWGTLDQGGNVVEWTDTIAKSPTGKTDGRVWRRLHGGIANAPAYQLWLSAVGLQPEDNAAFTATYPWLGFRIGVLGKLKPGGG